MGFKNRKDPDTDTSHLSKDLGRHAAKAFASVAAAQIFANVVGLGGTIILARLLGPEEFGLMAMLATAIALLAVFENFGLYFATIQKKVLSNEELNFMFWVNLGFASLMGAIMFFGAPLIAAFFEQPQLEELSQILALAFVFRGAANQHAALLNRKLQHGKSSLASVIAVFFATVGAIILAIYGFGVWALVLRQVFEAVVRTVVLWMMTGWIPRWVGWNKEFMGSLGFGLNVTLSNLMYYISRNSDDILIGKYIGATGLGFYKLSYQILLLPLRRINEPVTQVMVPLLSQLQDDKERYLRNYTRATHVLMLLQIPIGIIFMFHTEVLVEIVFGTQWLPAAEPLRWLSASLLIQGFSNTTGWLFISQARSKEMLYWSIFTSATTVMAFVYGLQYGIAGVAAAYVIVAYARMPLLIAISGNSGPVNVKDLYNIILAYICPVLLYAVLNYVISLAIIGLHPVLQLGILALCGLAFFGCMIIFPKGRRILYDGKDFVLTKLKNRGSKKNVESHS